MGCACNGTASPGDQWVIRFADGTVSTKYPDESSARIALVRTGKTGIIKKAPK
ncbi:MAG: hypothetical protein ABWZ52_13820 [Acidimicrobiales bacterium]